MKTLKHHYSNKVAHKKILIIGPIPPPLGGIAIHIKRVVKKFEQQNNTVLIHNCAHKRVNKLVSLWSLLKDIFSIQPNIVYYHEPTESVQKFLFTIICKYFFLYQLIVVDHDCRSLYSFSKFKKKLFSWCINCVHHAVVIGDTTDRCYQENNIKIPKNYSIESPFLPPDTAEEQEISAHYPAAVQEFICAHSPLLSANAFAPVLLDGKDLYGIDLCIELVEKLRQTYPNVGLVFAIGTIKSVEQKKYFSHIQTLIKNKNLETHFYCFSGQQEFWPIIKRSNLFLRPTLSDSFGISAQEAVFLNVPVIASNVCSRPEGANLFEITNKEEFFLLSHAQLNTRSSDE